MQITHTISYFYNIIFIILGVFSFINILSILFFYIASWGDQKTRNKFKPSISIIVPAHNEEKNIADCLNSILNSKYDHQKLQIICVNDKSTDKTAQILKGYSKKYKHIQVVNGPRKGKAAALNHALKHVKCDYVFVLDADTTLSEKYLASVVAPFGNPAVGYSSGSILIYPLNSFINHYQALEYCYMNLVRGITAKLFSFPMWFNGSAVCYRLSALKSVDNFHQDSMNEDFDISLRLYPNFQGVVVPEAIVYTKPMYTLAKLIKQRMRWYYDGVQNLIKHSSELRLTSPVILYVYLTYLLWLFNSLVIFPAFAYSVIYYLAVHPALLFFYWLNSGTILGLVLTFYANGGLPPFPGLIYFMIGCVLVFLYLISILISKQKITFRLILSLFSYFTYLALLQASFVLALAVYGLPKKQVYLKK